MFTKLAIVLALSLTELAAAQNCSPRFDPILGVVTCPSTLGGFPELAWDNTNKQLQIVASPSGINSARFAVLRTNVVSGTIGSAETIVFQSSDTISANTSQNAVYGTYTNQSTVGCTVQANCGTNSEPHAIGVLGTGSDLSTGNVSLYGVEGRINAVGLGTGHKYVGVVGVSSWQGAAFAAEARAHDALITITTDGTTPLAQGTATSYYARAIIGGATKWSFYGPDPAYFASVRIGGVVGTPTQKLDVWDTASPAISLCDTTNPTCFQVTAQDAFVSIGTVTNHPLIFTTNATSYGIITATGTWGIGSNNLGPTGTLQIYDATASTGATTVTVSLGAAQTSSSTTFTNAGLFKFAGSNSTAAVAGLIGTTCPAVTCTAAYTWVKAVSSDGSTVYFPVWK